MGLTNREKLEIITRAKKDNYTGNYLDLFNQAAAEGRQKMPEVRRAGGFIYDVNKPDKSTYVDARSGYGFPTTYEHGGPHAEYPPYDSLTDFQKQNISRDEYGYTTMEMGVDGREFVPGPGGTLDSLAMHEKSDEVQHLMTPYFVNMKMPKPDGSFDYQTKEEAEKEAQRLSQENPLDNFYSNDGLHRLNPRFEEDFGRNEIDNPSYRVGRGTYDGKDMYYPGRSAENQSQNLAKLREGHEGIQPHPSNVFTPERRMKLMQQKKAYLMRYEGNSEEIARLDSEIANLESGNNPDYYELGKTSHNMIFPNMERGIEENINNINYYDASNNGQPSNVPLYSEGTRIPNYNRPVGRPIPNKPVAVPPRIEPRAPGPIPTNFVEPELQKATMPEFPDTGPNKADLFFENLENANTFKNRPDKMSDRSARNVRGKDDVSSEYIFSDDNPYAPQKGEYFMSEANSRGKRKYDGDLNAARKWERENGLGIQTDLKGYDVGPDIQKHGGFSRMFKQDFSKYINKKEDGGVNDNDEEFEKEKKKGRIADTRQRTLLDTFRPPSSADNEIRDAVSAYKRKNFRNRFNELNPDRGKTPEPYNDKDLAIQNIRQSLGNISPELFNEILEEGKNIEDSLEGITGFTDGLKAMYNLDLSTAKELLKEANIDKNIILDGTNMNYLVKKYLKSQLKKGGYKSIKRYGHGGPHDDTAPLPIGDQQSMLDNTRVPIINLNKITSNEMPSNEVAVNPPVNERRQFINFLKEQEAGPEFMRSINSAVKKPDGTYYKAFEDGKFYPYFQGKEKEATIGYGRKAANVLEKYNKGITEQEALGFMNKDIDRSLSLAKEYVENNQNSPLYGDIGSFGRLDSNTQYLLSDYTYNVGKLSKFPNFTKAVLTNDPVGMEEEYIRVEDKSTNIPLKRNKPFYDLYLKPRIDKLKQNNK